MSPLTPPHDGQSSTTVNVANNQFDLPGLLGLIQKFSAATVLTGFAVALFLYQRSDNAAARADMREQHQLLREALKEEGQRGREAARESHAQFLDDAKLAREQMVRQWDELRRSNEQMRELQRSIVDHQKLMKDNQETIREMITEVKKIKAPGGGGTP